MLQQDEPNNYVIATGDFHTLSDFLDEAFNCVGIDDWTSYVKQDAKYMRPADVFYLRGDSTRARKELGWKPKTSFSEMISKMVQNDIKLYQ
jgi:GDPmannose 4,6-dehydratase